MQQIRPVLLATAFAVVLFAGVAARAAQDFDDRAAFDAAVAAANGDVQFEDWDGLTSSVGTTGTSNNPIPPFPFFLNGTALDTGYAIGTEALSMVWIENAGDIGNVQTNRAFGSNQALVSIGIEVRLDDANVIGVDVFGAQTATSTLLITVFDTDDQLIDSFSRTVEVATGEFFGYIGDVQVGRVRFEVDQNAGPSVDPVEFVDNLTFGNTGAPPAVPSLSAWGAALLGSLLLRAGAWQRRTA